jgi:DNA-cytosine methyltransferase
VIVLSLFDGISCARVALTRLGYTNIKYYASEVDKYAIQIAQKNFPDTIQLGDVRNITASMFGEPIDLLIGGSPCQDLSIAKNNRQGLDGERSGLFWEYVRIWKELKPRYFVLENVNSMPKEAKRIISETMGVEPIMLDASLVSAQSRKRLFWTNIETDMFGTCHIPLPEDRGILLRDILETGVAYVDKTPTMTEAWGRGGSSREFMAMVKCVGNLNPSGNGMNGNVYSTDGKSPNLTTNKGEGNKIAEPTGIGEQRTKEAKAIRREMMRSGKDWTPRRAMEIKFRPDHKTNPLMANMPREGRITDGYTIRKLTPIECERLQSLPDNYTDGISNTQRYKCLGNAFNVEVVRHILSYMGVEL